MEDRAPYHTEVPKGPRNLTAPLAAWLRTQGFTVTEQTQPQCAAVGAHWLGPRGERFQLTYLWQNGPLPDATCWLEVRYPGQAHAEVLFTPQHVRRLKEARQLVNGCVRLYNARLLASLAAPLPTAP
ncbi:MAG: hypothetical protein ACRYFZ_19575 [Janthinobacterium lividum]